MYDIVEGIHKALRIESTWAFVLVIALGAGLVGGFLAWIIDTGYKNSPEYKAEHTPKQQAVTENNTEPPVTAFAPPVNHSNPHPRTQLPPGVIVSGKNFKARHLKVEGSTLEIKPPATNARLDDVVVDNKPQPNIQVSAPNGVAIGSIAGNGNVVSPTVNNFGPPPPTLTWTLADLPQPQNAKHPRTFAKLSLDRPWENPKFAVLCDRPCQAVGFSMEGFNKNCAGHLPGYPDTVAAFDILEPNPMPARIEASLSVDSKDDVPVKILDIKKLIVDGPSNCR